MRLLTPAWFTWSLLVGLLGMAGPARAGCPAGAVSRALAARLDGATINAVKNPFLAGLSSQFEIPSDPITLFTCPSGFDDMIVTPKDGVATVSLRSANVTLEEGALLIDAEGDVQITSQLDMIVCAGPDAVCSASVDITSARVQARVIPSVTDCTPSLDVVGLSVTVDPAQVTAELGQCGLYPELWQLVYDNFKGALINLVVAQVESAVRDLAPEWLGSFTSDLFLAEFESAGMKFLVAPERVDVTAEAITASFVASVSPSGAPAPCLPAKAAELLQSAGDAGDEPDFGTAPSAVVASRVLVQQAFNSAWLAGWLCYDSRDYDFDLGSYLSAVIPEADLTVRVAAVTPPELQLAPEAGCDVRLVADSLAADVDLEIPGSEPTYATAALTATVEGRIAVDRGMRSFVVEPTGVAASGIEVVVPERTSLVFSQESLAGFLEHMIMPLFGDEMGVLPVTSSLLVESGIAFVVDALEVTPSQVRADLALFAADPSDREPPSTVALKLPGYPTGDPLEIGLASTDNDTPKAFMRHQVTIDGVPEAAPRDGQKLVFADLTPGPHRLALSALDLAGNQDPEALHLDVLVDAEDPLVTITEWPAGAVEEEAVTVRFKGTDNYSPDEYLTYRYVAGIISEKNEPDQEIAAGELGSAHELRLTGLPEFATIRVTVYARDEAGNEGSAEIGFATLRHPNWDCSAGGGGIAGALAAAVVLATRRRARLGLWAKNASIGK